MTKSSLLTTQTFLLQIAQDHPSLDLDWSIVSAEIADWGRELHLQLTDRPYSGLSPKGNGACLLIRLSQERTDLLSTLAGLHNRLYELPINIELKYTSLENGASSEIKDKQ